jgi:SAM-dependent methyltransferase
MSETVFGQYARYYNLLYKDKDYAAEARYVHELIQRHGQGTGSVLNLGCGTGNHDFELAQLGYGITGVDLSDEMLVGARLRGASLSAGTQSPSFVKGDIRSVRIGRIFETVTALFHVISYQATNDDLAAFFSTACAHLQPGGLLIFDCWYGPGVYVDPPAVRVKRLEDDCLGVIRIAEPKMHHELNCVDVNFEVHIRDKVSDTFSVLHECHRMRYLFVPEIQLFLKQAGFEPAHCYRWLTFDPPDAASWNIICLARKL